MFKADKFQKQQWQPRTDVVAVPELAPWFDDGEAAVFEVRGLTGLELSACQSTKLNHKRLEALVSSKDLDNQELATIIKSYVFNTQDLSDLDVFKIAVVNKVFPEISLAIWKKVFTQFPYVLNRLSEKIIELTYQGPTAEVKPEPCGDSNTSET